MSLFPPYIAIVYFRTPQTQSLYLPPPPLPANNLRKFWGVSRVYYKEFEKSR